MSPRNLDLGTTLHPTRVEHGRDNHLLCSWSCELLKYEHPTRVEHGRDNDSCALGAVNCRNLNILLGLNMVGIIICCALGAVEHLLRVEYCMGDHLLSPRQVQNPP